jgi:hypothetical protein
MTQTHAVRRPRLVTRYATDYAKCFVEVLTGVVADTTRAIPKKAVGSPKYIFARLELDPASRE